ncbi:MAG: M20/M25/M40 family metallo-hydrolase [Solirubrobacteraceae bacterium]
MLRTRLTSTMVGDLQEESTEVLQRLLRFNTVNPPGNEQPAIEYLASYLQDAGFQVQLLQPTPGRPSLVADLPGTGDGPTLCYLGHVDTVLADPSEWEHDPWSGDLADGFLWGRGALDMKSQVAAEAVAGAQLARSGWRPSSGHLKLVFVADEETGGELGAQWLTSVHPDKVRCDLLLNEGGGHSFTYDGRRIYGVCCGEKGVFRFKLVAQGVAGHASLPKTGDNALLKLGPALVRFAHAGASFVLTDTTREMLSQLGFDPSDPARALNEIEAREPILAGLVLEPMLSVTLTPTMAHASDKDNVIPSRAEIKVDCRVPPGLGAEAARQRVQEVLGDAMDGLELEFAEQVVGNQSPVQTDLMEAISGWVSRSDPEAETVPVLLPGFSDTRWFRDAFPECVGYGFFPHRHMSLFEAAPLVHSANERIDVRDLAFATTFYADVARELLGNP